MHHHHTRTLAGTTHCNVLQCSCGMLHVTLGPLTMRVEPGSARTLRDVLDAALAAIAGDGPGSEQPRGASEVADVEAEAAGGRPRLRLASSRKDELPS
jgi:hypothetical protein